MSPVVALPEKLSDLLDAAVEDARAVEATPGYALDMGSWHEPVSEMSPMARDEAYGEDVVCVVCMAGAVMVRRLGAQPDQLLEPNDYENRVQEKLLAVNCLRLGDVRCAADLVWGLDFSVRCPEPQRYAMQRARFAIRNEIDNAGGDRARWTTYRRAARILREAGL